MVVLKNIPRILSPQLLSVLARMGHGDEIGRSVLIYIFFKYRCKTNLIYHLVYFLLVSVNSASRCQLP